MWIFKVLLGVALLTLLSCAVSSASPRARFRAETILNDESKRISVGFDHTCKINEDGTVRCWGGNSFGQLGNNSTTASSTPVLVSGISSAVAVAAGRFYTCAVLSDGTARCWGVNNLGQLGKGSITTRQLTPVVVTGLTNVVGIATGQAHACALLANGRASCWGTNNAGQLGRGTFFFAGGDPTPGEVINLSNAIDITAGFFHTCALIADGTAKCWGTNVKGELGIGTFQDGSLGELAPVPVRDVSNAVAIAAGGAHTCAVLADSTAKCWGLDNHGQLGDHPTTDQLTDFVFIPVAVIGSVEGGTKQVLNNIVAITAGNAHTCALLADGTAKCWGFNVDGQLGIGSAQPDFVPATTVVDAFGDALRNVVAISTGGHRCFVDASFQNRGDFQCAGDFDHTCALLADGSAKCWGSNRSGELGSEVSPGSTSPVTVTGGGGSFTARDIAAGRNHTCAVRANGTVACWGSNSSGQIGDGTIGGNRLSPFTIPNLSNVVGIAAGEAHTCALRADGTAKCWGANGNGQLGVGNTLGPSGIPVTVSGLSKAVAIAAGGTLGGSHTCALIADGTVQCWGANGSGQLGTGNTTQSSIPVTVSGLRNAISIAAGENHTCALVAVGVPFCWGFNGRGQLGDGTLASQNLPKLVSLDNTVAIAGGNLHTCAVRADGSTWCWGENLLSQLGINSTASPQPMPKLVVDPTNAVVTSAVAVAGGFGHSCALLANGRARCWGDNGSGQLGDSSNTQRLIPAVVQTGTQVQIRTGGTTFALAPLPNTVQITTGRRHSCTVLANGAVFCWGENTFGQLGIGSLINQASAVGVPSFTLNIDPTVALRPNDRVTTITVIATCEAGQRLFFDVNLTQGGASGRGHGSGECTGALERYPLTVPALGRNAFLTGPAEVSAKAVIVDKGTVVDIQEWTRLVSISNSP
jgi:alpha-tubulin suppressor-like RCC1 family protein